MRLAWRRTGLAVACAACVLTTVIAIAPRVAGYAWDNRGKDRGYFDNGAPSYTKYTGTIKGLMSAPNYVDSKVRPAIPYSVTTPQEYYDYMYDKYNHTGNPAYSISYGTYKGLNWDEKDRTGISFMVNVLLGRDGDHAHRHLTDEDWQLLHTLMTQPGVRLIQLNHADASSFRGQDSYYQVSRNDVGSTGTDDDGGKAFALTYHGQVEWVVLYKCGNVLGDWPGLPQLSDESWSISAEIDNDQTFVNVGDTVTWHHKVVQQGPDPNGQAVTYGYRNSGNIAGLFDTGTLAAGTAADTVRTFDTTYVPKVSDSGKQICRQTAASPSADDAGQVLSVPSCVTVNVYYDYELHPTVTLPSGGTRDTLEPGGGAKAVTPKVTIEGTTGSRPTTWQVTRCLYKPGTGYPTITTETTNNASAAATFGGICTPQSSGGDTYTGTRQYPDVIESNADLATGSHVCFILTVSPPNASAGGFRHSPPACFSVLKTPKIQAWGGDIRAGRVVTSAPRQIDGAYYGSWAEYGIYGVGAVSGMASAASLAGGAPSLVTGPLTALTFANKGTAACQLGCYYAQAPTDDYFGAYRALASEVIHGPAGRGGAVGPSTRAVVSVDGDLTVTGDITYPQNYSDPTQIPRVIYVVNGNITVADGVTRIDAWLITNGTLFTCASYTGQPDQKLTAGTCDKQLVFNGPVTAAKTVLGRTFGADVDADSRAQAAEVFNLAPQNYVSGYVASQGQSSVQTVYEKELPPRY